MKVDTFFQNFEFLTDAPNAVAKLRELILQLAVMGKLVHQDLKDESASVLLEKIKIEKEELVKHKKLRKLEQVLPINASDLSYEAPKIWEWVRLDSICYLITDGTHHTPKYIDSGVPFLSVKDVSRGEINLSDTKYISREEHEELIKRCHPEFEDVLLTKVGTTGIAKVIDIEAEFSIFVSLALLKFSKKILFTYYIELALNSPFIKKQSARDTQGIGNKNLVLKYIKNFIFPLPPLAEQKRIVEKCDRLLSICDEIEKRQQQRQESILRMNESAIAQLLCSQNPDDFRYHWQRICNNFDLLYSIPETIPKLRQAILQLAVHGKLTNQSSKEFKKTLDTHKVSDYLSILNGYAFKSTWFINDGIRLLRNANVGHGDLRWDDVATISEERAQEFQRFKLDVDDIVISLDRPIISTGLKIARITNNDLPCLLLQRVGKFEFKTDEVIPEFFFLWLQSPIFIDAIDPGRSNGVPHISSKSIEAIPFNPPSREEQKRIVEKCDRLMSLCDTLEAKLKQGRESSEKLMEVAARQVLTT